MKILKKFGFYRDYVQFSLGLVFVFRSILLSLRTCIPAKISKQHQQTQRGGQVVFYVVN